jgi:hypothetical protein
MAAFALRTRGGILSRLPDDFHFPHSTSYDCWRNGTLGTWRSAFCHRSLWYQKSFNFLTSLQKRPTDYVDNRGNTGQIEGQHRSSMVILNFFILFWKKQQNNKAWTPSTIVLKMFEALENEIRTACGKNKRMDQLKWPTVVKKL